jgi:hypothetical protein
MKRVQGWTFAGLGSDSAASPGPRATQAGGIAIERGEALIRQSLMLLLATAPGERVMRPDYGCPLDRLLFAPNDATTAGLAIHYVRQAIHRWEPRISIQRLDAGRDEEGAPERLRIRLDYLVKATQRAGTLSFALDLDGAAHA